jgi:hypothetical protein
MITIRQFIQQLSRLDPNLPVHIRWDTFIPASLLSKNGGAHSGWEHQPALSHTASLNAEDVAPVWDHSTNTISLEISGRHFAPVVSVSTNAPEVVSPIALYLAKDIAFREVAQQKSNLQYI